MPHLVLFPRMKASLFNSAVLTANIFGTALQANFSPAKFRVQIAIGTQASFMVNILASDGSTSVNLDYSMLGTAKATIIDHLVRRGFQYNYLFAASTQVLDMQVQEIAADA